MSDWAVTDGRAYDALYVVIVKQKEAVLLYKNDTKTITPFS
ncbi:hypothetical protein [Geomicrobium sp. JCM 19038]|nr:hypothetical protein [Geomicrobium sp. JCM 19038]